eukprot:234078_1
MYSLATKSTMNMDMNIFKSISNKCFGYNQDVSINECDHLHRILHGLKYYSLLKLDENPSRRDIFAEFCDIVYPELLNDYSHVICKHSTQLETIYDQLITDDNFGECVSSKCILFKRYYDNSRRQSSNKKKKTEWERSLFYGEIFDNIHQWLFHLFETGMRTRTKHIDNEFDAMKDDEKTAYIDKQFQQKRQDIVSKREKLSMNSDRFNNNNNKFKIQVDTNWNSNTEEDKTEDEQQDKTFMDVILKHFEEIHIQLTIISDLFIFLETEEFDTDAIHGDVQNDDDKDSNIVNFVNKIGDKQTTSMINDYLQDSNRTVFSTGFAWIYCPPDVNDKQSCVEMYKRLLGDSIEQLFVDAKYETYKEEILSHLNMEQYEMVMTKAQEYMQTNKVKRMGPLGREYRIILMVDYPHFDDKISIEPIMSIILYTDFSEYCTDFSSTYRKLTFTESFESVKTRNASFWFQSRFFRQAIQAWGVAGTDLEDEHSGCNEIQTGPFHTGLSIVMAISQFAIKLSSPTSVSAQIEVAINFAKRKGMILTLNNEGGSNESMLLTFFDCSWISQYPDEDERVFEGSSYSLKVETIRIVETSQNFKKIIHALYVFDSMVSGLVNNEMRNSKIINHIKKLLGNESELSSFDPYVISLVKAYIYRKRRATINFHGLFSHSSEDLYGLIIESGLKKVAGYRLDSKVNLLSANIFKIFPYLEEIVIRTHTFEGYSFKDDSCSYAFNLMYFIEMISKISTWNKITIHHGASRGGSGISYWIEDVCSSYLKKIKNKCKKNQITVQIEISDMHMNSVLYFVNEECSNSVNEEHSDSVSDWIEWDSLSS